MKRILIYLILLGTLSSCHVFYPGQMLRPGYNYKYTQFHPETKHDEYRLAPYDIVSFSILPNNGEKILTSGSGLTGSGSQINQTQYNPQNQYNQINTGGGYSVTIESDGKAKLPVFGRIQLGGLTIREAEKMLEEKFTAYVKEPYVRLNVINKRVFLLYTSGVGSRVIYLINDNTTLFEALAESGGTANGKAYKIKLIRGDLTNPQIYLIDLSTIKGVGKSNLTLQSNDIIYVENPLRLNEKIVSQINPYLALISTLTLVYNIFIRK